MTELRPFWYPKISWRSEAWWWPSSESIRLRLRETPQPYEGRGYEFHWDVSARTEDKYYWEVEKEPKRYEWEAGDVIFVPVNTVHQHFNSDPEKPARLLSGTNRIYKDMGFHDLEQIEDAPKVKGL